MSSMLITKSRSIAKNTTSKSPQKVVLNKSFSKKSDSQKIAKTHFDFSTEDYGYFTKRDERGNIIEKIRTLFCR